MKTFLAIGLILLASIGCSSKKRKTSESNVYDTQYSLEIRAAKDPEIFYDEHWNMKRGKSEIIIYSKSDTLFTNLIDYFIVVHYCFSSSGNNMFYINQTSGHYWPIINYNLKSCKSKTIESATKLVGIFEDGQYKDMLLFARHEFPEGSGNPEHNYRIIDSNGRIVKTIGFNPEDLNQLLLDEAENLVNSKYIRISSFDK